MTVEQQFEETRSKVATITAYGRHEVWKYADDTFCPSCGKPEVWVEDGRGDYDLGSEHICTACGESFTLQIGGISDGGVSELRFQQLRARSGKKA